MAYNGGIGYEIDQLAELGVPELMRKQSVDPQLKYALALQEATKMVEAAARERDMAQQMPMPADVVGQMETSLAKRLAPGIQQQGQRSMQMQNRPAMGLPGQAAPNLARMANGGIVGYAKGDMVEIGAKSKGPIPQMSPEENAMVLKYLEGLKKFDYYDKNPDKVSPEGRQALEQDRRMFEEQFPNSFKQKVNEMMYGPDKGMAMGGTVKGYAGPDGSLVEEDEPFIDLGALFELIGRGRDALFSPSRATQEAREIRRGEVEQAGERGTNLLNVLPPSQGLTPEQLASFDKYDVTGAVPTKIVEERRERVESGEAARDLAQQAARRAEANAARREGTPTLPQNEGVTADMYMMPEEELTMAQKLMQLPKVAREAKPAPSKTGIAGLLQKAKPFADKAADIAEILGRGAGASKGFEFAKIAEESRKINQAEQARQDEIEKAKADRTARAELLREEYGFRDKELRSKLLSESMASEREADRELLETIMTSIESDPEFLRAAEEFKDTYDVFFGSYDKDKYAEALAKKRQELIEKRFNETKAQLASVLGGSSASSAMDDLAKYGN
jgi:hypothetical protein